VAVTLGAEGCLVTTEDGTLAHLPAVATDVVDTTGCGDGFNAGLITGLLLGSGHLDAARLGCACGALVASGLGSDAGIRDLGHTIDLFGRDDPAAAARIGRLLTHPTTHPTVPA
jgi:sugar/nucleoside kinase (ribokinase family)